MTPAAERLLAALADGYRVEVEDVGGWDADEWHLRKSIKFDGHLRDAARELYGLGLVDSSANGSGCCWINDAGRAAVDTPPVVQCQRPECLDNAKMRAVWADQSTRNADRMVTAERERDALRDQRDRLFAFLWELEREALSNRPVSIAKSAWGRIHDFVRNFPAPPSDVPPTNGGFR